MTSAERIKYRQENWRGKTFGNVSNLNTRVSDELVTMELLWKPIVTKEMEEYYLKKKGELKKKKKFAPKYKWKKIDNFYTDIFTTLHRKYDDEGLPIVEYDWASDPLLVDEYFKNLGKKDKMLKYIKFNEDNYYRAIGEDKPDISPYEEEIKDQPKDYTPAFHNRNGPNKKNLVIFNLPLDAEKDKLYVYFSKFGSIKNIHILTDKRTGKPKGMGFINTYAEKTSKQIIENCNGKPYGLSILRIQYSDKDKKR
jgi:hypothetical protein